MKPITINTHIDCSNNSKYSVRYILKATSRSLESVFLVHFLLWETGEKTYEPLSILAADDPVTCAIYAKENDLLHIEGWKRFRNLAKRDKTLARAMMQSKIRQVRRSTKYMFVYLIPRSYKEATEFDKVNNNTKWADATRDEMDCIKEQQVFSRDKGQNGPQTTR